jgi:uncharacterized protein
MTEITPEKMAEYRAGAARRRAAREVRVVARRERAWELARRGADLLRRDFGATRVVLIGSLARERSFHEQSDVDLVAWGVADRDYYDAVAALLSLDPEIEFDLIRPEDARPILLEAVQRDGREL